MRVLVTGATGMIGSVLVPQLLAAGFQVRATARRGTAPDWCRHDRCEYVARDLLADPGPLTAGIDAVVHLAARVHVMHDQAADPLAEFRRMNTVVTRDLAIAARASGAAHFVLMSSIKVNGDADPGHSFTESDVPAPPDPYGQSKLEAEQILAGLADGMAVTVLRPPLVYGPGVMGNLAQLARAVRAGVPLPLGSIRNRRSLVYVGNLTGAVETVLNRPAPGFRIFLVSDTETPSTPDIVRAIARAMGQHPRLVNVPPVLLRLAGRLFNRSAEIDRLLGDLTVDSSLLRKSTGWAPRFTLQEGFAASFSDNI